MLKSYPYIILCQEVKSSEEKNAVYNKKRTNNSYYNRKPYIFGCKIKVNLILKHFPLCNISVFMDILLNFFVTLTLTYRHTELFTKDLQSYRLEYSRFISQHSFSWTKNIKVDSRLIKALKVFGPLILEVFNTLDTYHTITLILE